MAYSPQRVSGPNGGYTSYASPGKAAQPNQFTPSVTIRQAKGGYAKGVVFDSVHGFSGTNPSVVHYGVVDPSIAVPSIHKPEEQWKDALGEQSYHAWKKSYAEYRARKDAYKAAKVLDICATQGNLTIIGQHSRKSVEVVKHKPAERGGGFHNDPHESYEQWKARKRAENSGKVYF